MNTITNISHHTEHEFKGKHTKLFNHIFCRNFLKLAAELLQHFIRCLAAMNFTEPFFCLNMTKLDSKLE